MRIILGKLERIVILDKCVFVLQLIVFYQGVVGKNFDNESQGEGFCCIKYVF